MVTQDVQEDKDRNLLDKRLVFRGGDMILLQIKVGN